MDAIGGQEMLLPALHPAEVWQESGRWDVMGENMFRLKDRFDRDLCLGMTHEEVMTVIARGELRSYKQLPQIWYQIQTKFRDEPRPKSGLLRVRQFIMKDSYTFDIDAAGLDAAYEKHYQAYTPHLRALRAEVRSRSKRIRARWAAASRTSSWCRRTRAKTWSRSARSAAITPIWRRPCRMPSKPAVADPEGDLAPEKFHTPGRKTIAEVAEFTGLPETSQMKSLVMVADGKPVLALLRGDHQLSETKFASAVGAAEVRPAHPHEIREWFGADAGSLGPVGVKNMPILADDGARRPQEHDRRRERGRLSPAPRHAGRGFRGRSSPICARSLAGDACVNCGEPLEVTKTIEIGHIFKLGYKYSESMGLRVLNADGRRSHADHGIVRHRHRAHSERGDRAASRRRTAWFCRRRSRRSRWW